MPEFTESEVEEIIESAGPRGNSVRNKIEAIRVRPAAGVEEDDSPEDITDPATSTDDPGPTDAGGDPVHVGVDLASEPDTGTGGS